jgi:hypothetical protein
MTGAAWNWIESASALLAAPEREAILGDLAESGEGFLSALRSVLGLAARRHIQLWANWRPWAASVGLTLPASLFLMGVSVAVSHDFLPSVSGAQHPLASNAIGKVFLLALWAFMAGFAACSISRRTLWATALACILPCLTCLYEWPGHSIAAMRLFLFLAPALGGVARARTHKRILRGPAVLLVASSLFLPWMWNEGGGLYGLGLVGPSIFLLTSARRSTA